tara:strand:- start:4312 stop:4557 length:246 start_codon:yes stop_codon:yes gene_type:complete
MVPLECEDVSDVSVTLIRDTPTVASSGEHATDEVDVFTDTTDVFTDTTDVFTDITDASTVAFVLALAFDVTHGPDVTETVL